MWVIDNNTVLVLSGISHLLLGGVCWLTLREHGSGRTFLWCIAGVLAGFGITLIGLRHTLPDWLGRELSVALMVCAPMLAAQSLRLSLSNAWAPRTLVLYMVTFVLVFHLLRNAGPVPARIGWILIGLLFWIGHMTWAAWRLSFLWNSRSARIMAMLYTGFTVVVGIALGSHLGTQPHENLWEPSSGDKLLHLASYLLEMVGALGYIGMMLERTQHLEVIQARRISRETELRKRSRELTNLDLQQNIAHLSKSLADDLRGPLESIRENCQRGREPQLGEVALTACVQSIIDNVHQATDRIERLRKFLKPPEPSNDQLELWAVTQSVLGVLSRDLVDAKIHVQWTADSKPAFVCAEKLDLSQAILNLIRQAIAVMTTTDQQVLLLRCVPDEPWARLEISGPPPTSREVPSVSLAAPTPQPSSEQELGLIVIHDLVEKMEGRLWFDSPGNQGAWAVMALPSVNGQAA